MVYSFIDMAIALSGRPDYATISHWRRTGMLTGLNLTEERVLCWYFSGIMYAVQNLLPPDDLRTKAITNVSFPLQRRIFPRRLDIRSLSSYEVDGTPFDFDLPMKDILGGGVPHFALDLEVEWVQAHTRRIVSTIPCVPMWGLAIMR